MQTGLGGERQDIAKAGDPKIPEHQQRPKSRLATVTEIRVRDSAWRPGSRLLAVLPVSNPRAKRFEHRRANVAQHQTEGEAKAGQQAEGVGPAAAGGRGGPGGAGGTDGVATGKGGIEGDGVSR